MTAHWLVEEQTVWSAGYRCIAGIDEAGRGALAGPVVAACVVLPRDFVPDGVNDSKQLSSEDRERCYHIVISSAVGFGIGVVQSDVIDRVNILKATHEAMRLALANLPAQLIPDIALIDGLPVHPFPITQRAIVGGDAASASIAAASILAKVTRDRIMVELHERFPQYLFAKHKGYGTRDHLRAIEEYGPMSEHRRSFKPVAATLNDAVNPTGQHIISFAQADT
jgi:ribonuclease HII